MTKLVWDQDGQRYYQSGIDRGVLYLMDGTAVVWNGLTSIEEDFGNDATAPYFVDGVKYLDVPQSGDFAATLKAFTYPDEFLQCEGIQDLGNGLAIDDQETKSFNISYRTQIGNDQNSSYYKLHLCYNLRAVADDVSRETTGQDASATEFSWKLSAVPDEAPGFRPTAHVILDSRYAYSRLLQSIQDMLWGTATTPARIPPLTELIPLVSSWRLIYIYDNGDGTWTASGPDDLVQMTNSTTFVIYQANAVYLNTNTYVISDSYEPMP